jgi:hypothetical protein
MTEDRYWRIVDKLGWGTKSTDINKLGEELLNHIQDIEDIKYMRDYTQIFKDELDKIIYSKSHELLIDEKLHFWGGDDSYWDFKSHIVGMGKDFFKSCLEDPTNFAIVGDNYTENFEYVFTESERFAKTDEGKKILNTKKRELKLKRILKDE